MSRLLYQLSYTAMRGFAAALARSIDLDAESVTTGNPASPLTESNR
ncbi:hypothetical protein [Nocardia sp. SYP-A9097]|nr:hypothetical protein [Nocardia sp. SYP-A9097]